jgi:hypothetical protein
VNCIILRDSRSSQIQLIITKASGQVEVIARDIQQNDRVMDVLIKPSPIEPKKKEIPF